MLQKREELEPEILIHPALSNDLLLIEGGKGINWSSETTIASLSNMLEQEGELCQAPFSWKYIPREGYRSDMYSIYLPKEVDAKAVYRFILNAKTRPSKLLVPFFIWTKKAEGSSGIVVRNVALIPPGTYIPASQEDSQKAIREEMKRLIDLLIENFGGQK
ncbi:MAG: hypothetical protein KDC34_19510 [Saprospiraceae bacterium]|nr:hypothetical protein [Saprospiraceae bacterium]